MNRGSVQAFVCHENSSTWLHGFSTTAPIGVKVPLSMVSSSVLFGMVKQVPIFGVRYSSYSPARGAGEHESDAIKLSWPVAPLSPRIAEAKAGRNASRCKLLQVRSLGKQGSHKQSAHLQRWSTVRVDKPYKASLH